VHAAATRLGLAVVLAAVVTVVLVVAGRVHQPDCSASIFGQTALGALALKSWLASVALGLAAVQLLLALWLYRKLPGAPAPARWVGPAHAAWPVAAMSTGQSTRT
jgi:protein-S-isoprenylcysteine O-methyltransferase Ste14